MTHTLSALVAAGHVKQTVTWPDDDAVVEAAALAEGARRRFADGADTERVGVLMTNDRPTVEVIMGAVLAGAELVSLPLPGRAADIDAHVAFLRDACRDFGLAEVVVADRYADLVRGAGLAARAHSSLDRRPIAAPSPDGFALVQFTSGSTGPPRPIRVSDRQLGANVHATLDAIRPQPGAAVVSWLPLAHDMGLIGMLLAGLAGGAPEWADGGEIVLLRPETFLRTPGRWLEAVDHWQGTITAAPDFGYRHALRRSPAPTLDLSSLRCAIVGGEIVRADTLASFTAALSAHGLDERALCPAYGMADAGLAITITPPADRWSAVTVSTDGLADGVLEAAMRGGATTTLVSSGVPLAGYAVSCGPNETPTSGADAGSLLSGAITGHRGDEAATSQVGPIDVRGPSLGVDGVTERPLAAAGGWYRTGDIGFVDDGQVYVCGRTDDYIVAHGRNVYAPALEVAAAAVPGVRPGRVVAVNIPNGDWVVVAELDAAAGTEAAPVRALQREVASTAVAVCSARPDKVVIVEPGSLPLTSSGKVQRHRVSAALVTDRLQPA